MIDRIERPTVAEARRQLRELTAEALPILGYVIAELPRHGCLFTPPVLHVGTKARPDVADLLRVQRQEALGLEGDAWSQLSGLTGAPIGTPRVFVHIKIFTPARCEFKLAFRLDRHRRLLEALAAAGVVGIAAEALRVYDGRVTTPMLLLEVSGVGFLRALLRAEIVLDGGRA